jgi:hypothetical protein
MATRNMCLLPISLRSAVLFVGWMAGIAHAGVGDPQLRTDHLWYPGELACSTFERLFETQAALFEHAKGRRPQTEEERALAAWMWRNLHYAHGEEGAENLWGGGFRAGDTTTREYWTGLFAYGFGLCGTTHAQWTAELSALLGPGRARTVGVKGHNACEVFLTGDAYGSGRWALLDHDISTVVFDPLGTRLLSIAEIKADLARLANRSFQPERQHGWPLGGLHADDPQAYAEFNVVEHVPGYAGPPPMIHLRQGESLRRYHQPGLEDGRTFVFWGRNYRIDGVPGPERSRTWINQPERFVGTQEGSGYRPGQARYGNAVYRYRPNFEDGSYREGVIAESEHEVIFEFQTPYIIAATPATQADWGVYELGCGNGLQIRGDADISIHISLDRGRTWHDIGRLPGTLDATDLAKGYRQYWLKFGRSAAELKNASLEIMTVCQANPAVFPRLKDHGTTVTFAASGQALVSVGPTQAQAQQHVVEGGFGTSTVTLELSAPRGLTASHLYAAAHIASGNPPDPDIRYQIEYSLDAGRSWLPLVEDWKIVRRGEEPGDFWSQSFCYGDGPVAAGHKGPVRVRFRNSGGKRYLRAEAHLIYPTPQPSDCRITFAWHDDQGEHTAEQLSSPAVERQWHIATGRQVTTNWVEFAAP